jgi:YEATS domain-containing protein 4
VYVRPVPGGPDISTWLKKVVFVLHETFPNPVRNVEGPPFELQETGYGGFFIVVKLYFQPIASEKQQQRQQYLQLEPYGDEAAMAAQAESGLVRSEIVEFVEFNEPTEALWDALTSDAQWDYLGRGGAGKGKSRPGTVPAELRTVALPEKAPEGSLYTRDTEDALLTVLKTAMKKCEDMSDEAARKSKEVNEQLAKVKEGTDIDAKLLELHEKVPHKKK